MISTKYPVRALRATVAAALLATAGLAHAEGSKVTETVTRSDSALRALFTACHDRTGCEPWITDGTREGTQILRNIRRDWHSRPSNFTSLGDGRVVFTVNGHLHRPSRRASAEPYITDGTAAGTRLVRRIGSTSVVGTPWAYSSLGDGKFVFLANTPTRNSNPCVWVSDGTREETKPVICSTWQPYWPKGFTKLREGELLFSMNDGRRGGELWITDGTREGSRLVRNLTNDEHSSDPQELVQLVDGLVLFTADDRINGRELWVTDGTRRGTRMLTVTPPQAGDNHPKHLTPIGDGRALFSVNSEVWITDGTPDGTQVLTDERTRDIPVGPEDFTPLGNGLTLFTARRQGEVSHQLWVTDGSARRTRIVQEIEPQFRPQYLRALGDGRAIFWQWQPDRRYYALWVSDATRSGTSRVQQFPNMTLAVTPQIRMRHTSSLGDGRALFSYDNGRTGWEPWITDGTRQGTGLLKNISRSGSSMLENSLVDFTPFVPVPR